MSNLDYTDSKYDARCLTHNKEYRVNPYMEDTYGLCTCCELPIGPLKTVNCNCSVLYTEVGP